LPAALVLISERFIRNSFVRDDHFGRLASRLKVNGDALRGFGDSLQPACVGQPMRRLDDLKLSNDLQYFTIGKLVADRVMAPNSQIHLRTVEMHHTGCDPGVRAEIVALIEHVLSSRPGDWRVSIVGSQANDRWELKISGPNGFERSYTLKGRAGEHQPGVIRILLGKLVPR
jgi:hypothetical protein